MNERTPPEPDAPMDQPVFADVDAAIADIREGKVVLVVDDADRENEGDFVIAAEKCTPEAVNFMVTHGRGIVCLPVAAWRLDELQIPQMVSTNGGDDTAFTVSIDYRPGVTTGTSAHDRAVTAAAVVDPGVGPQDFHRPGHVFPLRAKEGGVLRRAGHTEAAVDLAQLAGLFPAGVICEVMHEDGTMARLPALVRVARAFDLKLISIADLIEYRRRREVLVQRVAEATLPTEWGTSAPTPTTAPSTGGPTLPSCTATSATATRCSLVSTPSASRATCSGRCGATAAASSTRRSNRWPRPAGASSCTCAGTRVVRSA